MKNRNEFIIGTWFLIILLFFSASHSKLIPYILPAMPAAALLMATHIIQNPSHRWKKRLVVSAGVLAALYTSLIIVLPNLSNRYSAKKLIDVIHEEKIENVVSYHSYPESATWLLKRTIPVVSFRGELASVGPLDSHLFWTEETFWQKWNNREPMAVFVRVNDDAPFHDSKNTPARLLGENKRYRLFSNVSSQNEKM